VSKKLQEKQRRRLAEQMRRERQRKAARRSNLLTIGVVGVIAALVVFGVIAFREVDDTVPEAPEGVAASQANCDEVEEHEIEGQQHVETTETVDYKTSPPTSGNHWPTGQEAEPEFYTQPLASESLVHNMEHGQIVIWYSPDASQELRDNLEALEESANDSDNPDVRGGAPPLIVVPFDDVPTGMNYVLTAWGASQSCENYSLAAINEFRTSYQGRGPEQVTAPFEG
jgi:hypothetical protein